MHDEVQRTDLGQLIALYRPSGDGLQIGRDSFSGHALSYPLIMCWVINNQTDVGDVSFVTRSGVTNLAEPNPIPHNNPPEEWLRCGLRKVSIHYYDFRNHRVNMFVPREHSQPREPIPTSG